TYTIPATTKAFGGRKYRVNVTSACDSTIVSSAAILEVNSAMTAYGLYDKIYGEGVSTTLNVGVIGTGPFSYAWKHDGEVLAETGSSLAIANFSSTVAGPYSVEVTSSCGTVTKTATLSVATIITYGGNATFSVDTLGFTSPTYKWKRNGVEIGGATTSAYIATAPPVSASGDVYEVVVSEPGFSDKIRRFVLTVNRAILTVTAQTVTNPTRLYGDPNPAFTYVYSGFVLGENQGVLTGQPVVGSAAHSGSSVSGSPYPIIVVPGTLTSANYRFIFVNGQLAVAKATLNVTAHNKSKYAGDPDPEFSSTITGLRNNDPIYVGYSTTPIAGGPNYHIVPNWADPSGRLSNYDETRTSGVLTVTTPPLVINLTQSTVDYTLGRPATPLDLSATITATPSTLSFHGKKLKAAFTKSYAKDYLSIRDYGSGAGQVGVDSALNPDGSRNVRYGGTVIGTCKGGTPDEALVVTFADPNPPTSVVTKQMVEAVLQNTAYYNTSVAPIEQNRTVTRLFSDQADQIISPAANSTISDHCPTAIDAVLVIDVTGSMNDPVTPGGITKLQAAINAAKQFLGHLSFSSGDRVKIITFCGDPDSVNDQNGRPHSPSSVTISGYFLTENDAETYINDNINSTCYLTVYHPALNSAFDAFTGADPQKLQVIVFLTDGKLEPHNLANIPNHRNLAVAKSREIRNAKIRMLTIGFGSGIDSDATTLLQEMAASYPKLDDCRIAPDEATLNSFYASIASSVCRHPVNYNRPPQLTRVNTLVGAKENEAFPISFEYLFANSDAFDFDGNPDEQGNYIQFRIMSVSSGTLKKHGQTLTTGNNGTLVGPGDSLTWTPAADQSGMALAAFNILAWDGNLPSETGDESVTVRVAPANSPPIVNAGLDISIPPGSIQLAVEFADPSITEPVTDPDNRFVSPPTVSWTRISGPAGMKFETGSDSTDEQPWVIFVTPG
ncbi:MAG: MBG domain-containing protein, partial [Candidatus Nitrotoga sp.]